MLRKILMWAGIVLAALVAVIVLTGGTLYGIAEARLRKTYSIPAETITIPTDAASIARGKHLADAIVGCVECHGPDLSGSDFFDVPGIATVHTDNLTSGRGGVDAANTDADWIRAIRHGVGHDGRGLLVMPVDDFVNLSEQDLGDVIAYVKSVPPVDKEQPRRSLGLLGHILFAVGKLPQPAVTRVNHAAPIPAAVDPGVTPKYGNYLASLSCMGCHGPGLSGGPNPLGDPSSPLPPNLTPGGELKGWAEVDFVKTIRTGVTPSGMQLPAQYMPWSYYAIMTDNELHAIWLYLQSIPAKPFGQR